MRTAGPLGKLKLKILTRRVHAILRESRDLGRTVVDWNGDICASVWQLSGVSLLCVHCCSFWGHTWNCCGRLNTTETSPWVSGQHIWLCLSSRPIAWSLWSCCWNYRSVEVNDLFIQIKKCRTSIRCPNGRLPALRICKSRIFCLLARTSWLFWMITQTLWRKGNYCEETQQSGRSGSQSAAFRLSGSGHQLATHKLQ